jgi:hypothetical protein
MRYDDEKRSHLELLDEIGQLKKRIFDVERKRETLSALHRRDMER